MSLPSRRTTNAGRVRSGIERAEQREWPTHRKWVRGFNCIVCEAERIYQGDPTEFAHARRGADGAMAVKPHDCFGLPLCGLHHEEQHNVGEVTFASRHPIAFRGKSMKAKALEFARQSPVTEVRERARRESV